MRSPLKLRMTVPVPIGVALALLLTPAAHPGDKPGTEAKAEAYRAQKQAATAAFFDPELPKAERLAAAEKLGYPEDETFAALLSMGTDRGQDDELRLKALELHRFDEVYLEQVLAIVEDPDDGGAELNARLIENLGRRMTFRMAAETRQRIQATLRGRLEDPRERVRLAAYRILVGAHDAVAVNLLSESLRQGENVPIPLADAIELLDLDGSIYHIGALRPYLEHPDPRVKSQAARALAVDPESRPAIVELAVDPETDPSIRLQALRALAREDPEFAGYAIRMVENPAEDPAIRHGAMKGFVGRMNYSEVDDEDKLRFARAVDKLLAEQAPPQGGRSTDPDYRKLRSEAKRLRSYLDEAFPVIRNTDDGE